MALISLELTGDEQKAVQAVLKLSQAQDELGKKTEDVGKKAKKAGDGLLEMAGKEAQSAVDGMITRYASLGAALGAVAKAFQLAQQAREKAAAGLEAQERATGQLLMISRGDAGRFAALKESAEALRRQGGPTDEAETARQIAALERAGIRTPETVALLAKMYPLAESPEDLLIAATKIARAFPKAGSAEQVMGKMLAVGERAGGPAELAAAVAAIAPRMTRHGYQPDEIIAATAALSGKLGGPEGAASALAKLARDMEALPGMRGRGLLEQVAAVSARHMRPEELTKAFSGRGEQSLTAFRMLADSLKGTRALTGEVTSAGQEDLLRKILGLAGGMPELAVVAEKRAALNAEEMGLEPRGVSPLTFQARRARITTAERMLGGWEIASAVRNAMSWMFETITPGAEAEAMGWREKGLAAKLQAAAERGGTSEASPADLRQAAEALLRAAQTFERINNGDQKRRVVGQPEDDR